MSAEALKVSSVLDTSHLKVKFPYKAKYGNYINGKFVEPLSGKYFDNVRSKPGLCSLGEMLVCGYGSNYAMGSSVGAATTLHKEST